MVRIQTGESVLTELGVCHQPFPSTMKLRGQTFGMTKRKAAIIASDIIPPIVCVCVCLCVLHVEAQLGVNIARLWLSRGHWALVSHCIVGSE